MAHSLQEFLNAATSNTIRANNQYELEATSGYPEIDKILETAVMFVQNFNIPGRSINFANVYFKGFEAGNLVPTHMTMETEHTMTVVADINGSYRRAFLAWQGKVIDPAIEKGSVFGGDRGINPKSILRVRMLDKDNETVVETYKLFNVRITNVGPITLTYESGDKATFEITAKSTYWEIEESKSGALTDQR